jgi:hypothetical protein
MIRHQEARMSCAISIAAAQNVRTGYAQHESKFLATQSR